jgi:hypothetical protein
MYHVIILCIDDVMSHEESRHLNTPDGAFTLWGLPDSAFRGVTYFDPGWPTRDRVTIYITRV